MSPMSPDGSPLRLDPQSYERLRQQVLRRDGWRCQSCGAMSSLEVHHKPISQSLWPRLRRKPDHTLLQVSCICSRPDGTLSFEAEGIPFVLKLTLISLW